VSLHTVAGHLLFCDRRYAVLYYGAVK